MQRSDGTPCIYRTMNLPPDTVPTEEYKATCTRNWFARGLGMLRRAGVIVLILHYLVHGIESGTAKALIYLKVCRGLYNETVCANLSQFGEEEDVVQAENARLHIWFQIVSHVPALIFTLVYGAVSDTSSRRLTILIPLFGFLLGEIIAIFLAIYIESSPWLILLRQLVVGISGGGMALLAGVYSYIRVATTPETRTKHIMIAEGVSSIASAVSFGVSGVFLDYTNFVTVFSVTTGVGVLNLLYAAFILVIPKEEAPNKKAGRPGNSQHGTRGRLKTFLASVSSTLTHSIKCVLKRRDGILRIQIIACLGIVFGSMMSTKATRVQYLFFRRRPLSWSQTTYGIYTAVHHVIPGLALVILIPPMKKLLKLRDTTLIALGIASGALSELLLSLSTQTWMVFLVPVVSVFHGATWIIRSVISGMVSEDEIGGIFAVLGAVQNMSGLLGGVMYNAIYPLTLKVWHGTVFAIGAGVAIIPFILACWLRTTLRGQPHDIAYQPLLTEENQEDNEDDEALID